MEKTWYEQETERWNNLDAYEQLKEVCNWCNYEDYSVITSCKNSKELIELYKFINFEVGVEFLSSVYELIEEEDWEEGSTGIPSETREMVVKFNKRMKRKIINI